SGQTNDGPLPTLSPAPSGSGARSDALHLAPLQVPTQILPQTLQPPDHGQLPVWEMLDHRVEEEAGDFPPVAVATVRHLFQQDRTDGDERGESVSKDEE